MSTCFSIGLDPNVDYNIICEQCREYFKVACKFNLQTETDETQVRPDKYTCIRPWDDKYKTHAERGKQARRNDILSLFGFGDDFVFEAQGDVTNNTKGNNDKNNEYNKNNNDSQSPVPSIALTKKLMPPLNQQKEILDIFSMTIMPSHWRR